VQIRELELAPCLPRLDALDAEFGCEDEQRAVARKRQGGAPLDLTLSPTRSELTTHQGAASPMTDAMTGSSIDKTIMRPSLAKRVSRGLARFLFVFGIGIAATLAWQSYGDVARAMIANSSPQLGWLAPQTAPAVPAAPDAVPTVAATSPELQQLTVGLAFVRQSIDQLASQLAADRRQLSGDIAKLQADEQEILHKLATPPRPAGAPAPKPDPLMPPPSPSAQAH
jgi:hypothetical protein